MGAADIDWDLLRHFLAVMRTKTLREAAADLKVSHPTIRRKLEALERRLGVTLFDRAPHGLRATPEASELLGLVEEIEAGVDALARRAGGLSPQLSGDVRVTVPDLLASELLMPDFAAFATQWPSIRLHIESTYELADLGKREADVAIRAMPHGKSPDGELVGRKAATLYAATYGKDHQWIGWWGDERDREWMSETSFADRPFGPVMPNVHLQLAACVAGLGLAGLPCFLADPLLERLTEPLPATDIWVLVHPDLRRSPRLRLFRDAMAEALERHRPRLEGHA